MEYSCSLTVEDDKIADKRLNRHFDVFLKTFWIFGLDFVGYDGPSMLFKLFLKIWTCVNIFCYHFCIAVDVVWYFNHKIQEDVLAESVTNWVTVITFDFMLWKRTEMQKLMRLVQTETSKLTEKSQRKQRRQNFVVFISVLLYVIIFVSQNIVFKLEEGYNKYYHISFLNLASRNLREFLFQLGGFLKCFFIQGLLTVTIAFYLLLCLTCKRWFHHLKRQYFGNRRSLNLFEVQKFCSKFDELSNHVRLLDCIFSLPVALWLLMILMILCVRIVSILNPLLLTTNQMITVTVLSFSRAVITLIQMNFIADSVYKKATITLFQLDTFSRQERRVLNNAMYQEIQMALTRFTFTPTQLTFWKTARLSRRFLMTCVGMMTTYVIISIQLYPNAKRGLESMRG
ncbi:uncharacterized protein CDAR_20791 [Caerostris darwini]|uniref:Gustatory receptor n=1 Tax=Caerostris darwini TaxID=1538125 RepID=A0AAV4QIV2_9ARAC|nr:uncharacterized protein CDAR_20791 [Caerostris darwini]